MGGSGGSPCLHVSLDPPTLSKTTWIAVYRQERLYKQILASAFIVLLRYVKYAPSVKCKKSIGKKIGKMIGKLVSGP